jgi:DNA-binding XRE family transcriptional regulator
MARCLQREALTAEQVERFNMYASPQRRSHNLTRKLRKQAGYWLRELRENRGLSQRELAQKVGVEYYTLISQLEHGYGRIPPNRYLAWANALAVEPQVFVRGLMTFYHSREPDDSCELPRSLHRKMSGRVTQG